MEEQLAETLDLARDFTDMLEDVQEVMADLTVVAEALIESIQLLAELKREDND